MNNYTTEIVVGVIGLTTTIAAWVMGGKQKANNERTDAITAGTDKIVETSNKMLERLEKLLADETERLQTEKSHREMCEKSLSEHKRLINELQEKVAKLERQIR